MDYTGTGNTLKTNLPNVLQLIMDSLRYWILDMHVDGFRFDLAATLARELHDSVIQSLIAADMQLEVMRRESHLPLQM